MAYADGDILRAGSVNQWDRGIIDELGQGNFLAYDNFDGARNAGSNFVSGGGWAINNYGFIGRGLESNSNGFYTVSGNEDKRDVLVNVRTTVTENVQDAFAGVVARFISGTRFQYYMTAWIYGDANDDSFITTFKVSGTTITQFNSINIGILRGWHNISLQVAGSQLAPFMDGKPYTVAYDTTLPSGTFGLINGLGVGAGSAQSHVMFDDFWVSGTG